MKSVCWGRESVRTAGSTDEVGISGKVELEGPSVAALCGVGSLSNADSASGACDAVGVAVPDVGGVFPDDAARGRSVP